MESSALSPPTRPPRRDKFTSCRTVVASGASCKDHQAAFVSFVDIAIRFSSIRKSANVQTVGCVPKRGRACERIAFKCIGPRSTSITTVATRIFLRKMVATRLGRPRTWKWSPMR